MLRSFTNVQLDREGKHWYTLDRDEVIHRFGNNNNKKTHWNGDTSQGRGIMMSPEVKNRFRTMTKEGFLYP